MIITKTNCNKIEKLRQQYFASLIKFQDIYLEFLVNNSDCYEITDNTLNGYAIVTYNNILIELYFNNNLYHINNQYIANIIKALNIKSIYCKTFDHKLLNYCLTNKLQYNIIGCLFRDKISTPIEINSQLKFRYAQLTDLPFMIEQNDEVFEPKNLLQQAVTNKQIILLITNNNITGCGFITQINRNFNYYDLGVWVTPTERKKGYATQIMLYMLQLCSKNNKIAICGCDINNTASQNMLHKLGFIDNYKLLDFTTN